MSTHTPPDDIPRIGPGSGRTPAAPRRGGGGPARIYELDTVRRRHDVAPAIPFSVWDEVDRASELAEDLAELGQQVRFETHHLSGRVVASLCNEAGEMLRPLDLYEVVGDPDPTPDPPLQAA